MTPPARGSSPFNTVSPPALRTARCALDAQARRCGAGARDHSGSAQLLAVGPPAFRVHERHDHAMVDRADAELGDGTPRAASICRRGFCCRSSRPGTVIGGASGLTRPPLRAMAPVIIARAATTQRQRSRRSKPAAPAPFSAPARGHCSAPSCQRRSSTTARRASLELHQRRGRLRDDAAAEEHRRSVAAAGVPASRGPSAGRSYGYDELLSAARKHERPRSGRCSIRIIAGSSSRPTWCPRDFRLLPADRTARSPDLRPRSRARILESLAVQVPRACSRRSSSSSGSRFEEIRIVGGGSRNRLLNQFTADATGCTVVAGPVEATALGNIAMQMLATGAVSSLDEARAHHRTLVSGGAVRAAVRRRMGRALRAFSGLRGDDLCLIRRQRIRPHHHRRTPRLLENLWNDSEAAKLGSQSARPAARIDPI